MISTLNNKMVSVPMGTHEMVCDGLLGGCGKGEVGDPRTYLPELWRDVIEKYGVRSVLDVGCGYGYSTKWFEDQGLTVHGLEGSVGIVEEALSASIDVHDFRLGKFDGFGRLPGVPGEFDLCWCSEFLEHLEAHHELAVADAFTRCKYLLLTAAPPGAGGHNHVNEQPPEHWMRVLAKYGFECDVEESNRLRQLADEKHGNCFFRGTGLFFRRVRQVPSKQHWSEIEGSMAAEDVLRLQDAAKGKRVLLLGADRGREAVAMAATATHVLAVDDAYGGAGALLANLRRSGVESKVEPLIGDVLDVRPEVRKRRFELVVVASEYGGDSELARDVILPGGSIVWVHWNSKGLRDLVPEIVGVEPHQIQHLGRFGVLETSRWNVLVTLPHSRGVELGSYKSVRTASIARFCHVAGEMDMDCGSLTHNFNTLLATCLEWRDKGIVTHLAMIHSDITAERGWVDLLAEEMHLHDCVAISAVVAIKDPDNDRTSTAIGSKSNPWEPIRYVHRRDMSRMPVTFTGKDVCQNDDEVLLINTGLLLLDLRCPFWDTFHFEVLNRIKVEENSDGKIRRPQFRPEDWEMSRKLDAAGLRYAATWRPFAEHIGVKAWTNRPPLTQVIHNDGH